MNKFKRWGIRAALAFAVMMILFFISRNFFLHKAFDGAAKRLKEQFQTDVSVSEIHFTGISGITLTNLVLIPEQQDTLLTIDSMYVRPSLLRLLIGKIRLKEAGIFNSSLSLICRDSSCNFKTFFLRRANESDKNQAEKNYAARLNHFVTNMFDFLPQKMNLQNINITYMNEKEKDQINMRSFISSDQKAEGHFVNLNDKTEWNLSGIFSQRKRTLDFKIYHGNEKKSTLPFLKSLFDADCKFDTLHFSLSEYKHSGELVNLAGRISADNFSLKHPKISDVPAVVNHSDFNFNMNVGKEYYELDSSSTMVLNKMETHPYFKYESDESKKYTLKFSIDKLPANDFFASLPSGMFDEVNGVEADGNLQYALNFQMDSSQPDSLIFNSALMKEKFRFKKSGKENLLKMNDEFLYSVFEHDQFVRSFMVGTSNPDFTPLNQISSSFKNAVMTSEDGGFFFHKGFNEDAFHKSIAANYKAGKFVRGGSTITMQLIKNVFLTRHKTIARKVEEALIVWLIENNYLCSKERMFEVYLNIIELGPDVYGIGEASRFYFSKKPAELNLAESVFLASLLPRPKWFKYSFDEQGNLKPYFADYYRVVANFLLKKNLITQDEYDHLQPHIELKGLAKKFVMPSASLPKNEEDQETE